MNAVAQNAEGIDLIDTANALVLQVSSTASKTKIESALAKDLAAYKNNQKEYISEVRKQIELQEMLLDADNKKSFSINDHAWDSELLKQGIAATKKQ